MTQSPLIEFDEHRHIVEILDKLLREASAKCIYLVDKAGTLIAASGETRDIDATSLASLTAGNIAATGGLAKVIGEKDFGILFHEGERDNLHISIVGQRAILVVIFGKLTPIGLVRLRVKKACEELDKGMQKLLARAETGSNEEDLLQEVSNEDIQRLFKP